MIEDIKPKRGAPSKYIEDMPERLTDMMSKGMLDCEVFAEFNVSKDTFYRWLNEKPEFKQAYDLGLPKCEAAWIHKFRLMLNGELDGKHSFNAAMAIANNKFKWTRGDNRSEGTQININNMNVLNSKTKDDLLVLVKGQLQELELIPQDDEQTASNYTEFTESIPIRTSSTSDETKDISGS